MRIAAYVSGHGYGHAVRCAEIARELGARGAEVVFLSSAEPEAFEPMPERARLEAAAIDVGVVQTSSLDIDEAGTLAAFAEFVAEWPRQVRAEARRLERLGAELVLADIAPLGLLAAREAGLPSALFANFTWDWIYRGWADREPRAAALADVAAEAFALAGRTFVPPLSAGLEALRRQEAVPLVVRRARRSRDELRRTLRIGPGEVALFVAFGGFGPPAGVATRPDLDPARVRAFGYTDLGWGPPLYRRLDRRRFEHPDLVQAADVVLGKPGYGTVAECALHGTRMLWLPRARFREVEPLERGIVDHVGGARLERADLEAGRLAARLEDALVARPRLGPLAGGGAAVVAERLLAGAGRA